MERQSTTTTRRIHPLSQPRRRQSGCQSAQAPKPSALEHTISSSILTGPIASEGDWLSCIIPFLQAAVPFPSLWTFSRIMVNRRGSGPHLRLVVQRKADESPRAASPGGYRKERVGLPSQNPFTRYLRIAGMQFGCNGHVANPPTVAFSRLVCQVLELLSQERVGSLAIQGHLARRREMPLFTGDSVITPDKNSKSVLNPEVPYSHR